MIQARCQFHQLFHRNGTTEAFFHDVETERERERETERERERERNNGCIFVFYVDVTAAEFFFKRGGGGGCLQTNVP